jgi:hypothetical protein
MFTPSIVQNFHNKVLYSLKINPKQQIVVFQQQPATISLYGYKIYLSSNSVYFQRVTAFDTKKRVNKIVAILSNKTTTMQVILTEFNKKAHYPCKSFRICSLRIIG